jgi:hypothetical protein
MEIIASDVVEQRVNMLTSSYDGAVANILTMSANVMFITLQTSREILTTNTQSSLKLQKMTLLKPKLIRNLLIERAGRVSRIRTSCLGSPGFKIILQTDTLIENIFFFRSSGQELKPVTPGRKSSTNADRQTAAFGQGTLSIGLWRGKSSSLYQEVARQAPPHATRPC